MRLDAFNLGDIIAKDGDFEAEVLIALAGETQPRIYSRRQLDELSNAAARGFVTRGLARSDRIAIPSVNRQGSKRLLRFRRTVQRHVCLRPREHLSGRDRERARAPSRDPSGRRRSGRRCHQGAKPVALVVCKPNTTLTQDAAREYLRSQLASFQHPRRAWFLPQLPVAGTKKIDRQLLTALACELNKANP